MIFVYTPKNFWQYEEAVKEGAIPIGNQVAVFIEGHFDMGFDNEPNVTTVTCPDCDGIIIEGQSCPVCTQRGLK